MQETSVKWTVSAYEINAAKMLAAIDEFDEEKALTWFRKLKEALQEDGVCEFVVDEYCDLLTAMNLLDKADAFCDGIRVEIDGRDVFAWAMITRNNGRTGRIERYIDEGVSETLQK